MRGVYGSVVLAEKLGLFLLGEVTKNHFQGAVRFLQPGPGSADMRPKLHQTRTLAGSRRPAGVEARRHADRPPAGWVDHSGHDF